jgi:hypothetical protein
MGLMDLIKAMLVAKEIFHINYFLKIESLINRLILLWIFIHYFKYEI